jgi:AcrR family transcriptional regulator
VSQRTERLSERRRRYVAAEISHAAIELFAARGFDAVTVDEIAAEAGTSPRTFFRYFASKDDVVLQYRRRLNRRLVDAVLARPAPEGAVTALRHAYRETATTRSADRPLVALRNRVLYDAPALRARAQSEATAPDSPLVDALAARMGVDPDRDDRPRLLAAAAGAVTSVAFEQWVRAGGRDDPVARIDAALALLEDGVASLDAEGVRHRRQSA